MNSRFSAVLVFSALTVMTLCCGGSSSIAPTNPGTPVGNWAGVLVASSATIVTLRGPTLNVAMTLAQAGQGISGTCSQSGGQNSTYINLPMSFPSGTVLANLTSVFGACGALIVTMTCDPVTDRLVNVSGSGGDYVGALTRQ
jgi:hypothetical protein